MTTLPAILPAVIAVCVFVAGVGVVLLPVCAWIDWRDRQAARRSAPGVPREAAERGLGTPNAPQ